MDLEELRDEKVDGCRKALLAVIGLFPGEVAKLR